MGDDTFHTGPHVIREISGQCGGSNAEKADSGCYEQVRCNSKTQAVGRNSGFSFLVCRLLGKQKPKTDQGRENNETTFKKKMAQLKNKRQCHVFLITLINKVGFTR